MTAARATFRRKHLWIHPSAERYYPYQLRSDRADVLLTVGRWDEVEADYRANLEHAMGSGDRSLVADAKYKLARIVFNRGDLAGATVLYREALGLYDILGDQGGIGRTCGVLGIVLTSLGEYDQAMAQLERGLVIMRQTGDRRNEGNILNNIGNVFSYRGDFASAREHYRQKLAIATALEDREGMGRALGNIGITLAQDGDLAMAVEPIRQALQIAHQLGDKQFIASSVGNLGTCYEDMGEKAQAIDCYRTQLGISRELGDLKGEVISLSNVARLQKENGLQAEALDLYDQAIALCRQLERPYDLCDCLVEAADIRCDQGRCDEAEALCAEAHAVAHSIGKLAVVERAWVVGEKIGKIGSKMP